MASTALCENTSLTMPLRPPSWVVAFWPRVSPWKSSLNRKSARLSRLLSVCRDYFNQNDFIISLLWIPSKEKQNLQKGVCADNTHISVVPEISWAGPPMLVPENWTITTANKTQRCQVNSVNMQETWPHTIPVPFQSGWKQRRNVLKRHLQAEGRTLSHCPEGPSPPSSANPSSSFKPHLQDCGIFRLPIQHSAPH